MNRSKVKTMVRLRLAPLLEYVDHLLALGENHKW
jgi:hypothetical protein